MPRKNVRSPGDVADVHRQVQAQLVELGAGRGRSRAPPWPRTRTPACRAGPRTPAASPRAGRGPGTACGGRGRSRAKAKIPLSRAAKPIPSSSYRWGRISVSQWVVSLWPRSSTRSRSCGVVVDLAVVDDDHRAVLVGHRLRAARHVLDGQPPVAEVDAVAVVEALAVGAAVDDRVGHGPDAALRHRSRPCPLSRTSRPVRLDRAAAASSPPERATRSSRSSTAVTSIFSASRRCRAACQRGRGRGEYLLDRGQRHVVLVLGEVPDQAVAPLLVVGVAAAGGRDEHRRARRAPPPPTTSWPTRRPPAGRGRAGGGSSPPGPATASSARSAGSGPSEEMSTRPRRWSTSTRWRFCLAGQAQSPAGRGRPARTRTARSSTARPG